MEGSVDDSGDSTMNQTVDETVEQPKARQRPKSAKPKKRTVWVRDNFTQTGVQCPKCDIYVNFIIDSLVTPTCGHIHHLDCIPPGTKDQVCNKCKQPIANAVELRPSMGIVHK